MSARVLGFDGRERPRFPDTTQREPLLRELQRIAPRLRIDRLELIIELAREFDPETSTIGRTKGLPR